MNYLFKNIIDTEVDKECVDFYNTRKWNAIEQHPLWLVSTEPLKNVFLFSARDNNDIVCTAVIEESSKLTVRHAHIPFGPLFADESQLVQCIDELCKHYKKRGFAYLTIQLGIETGPQADFIEYNLHKIRSPRYFYDRNNWSSIMVSLMQDEDQLIRNFSKGHKSDVKKAQKSGLIVSTEFTDEKFDSFINVYRKMHQIRGLKEPPEGASAYLRRIKTFFDKYEAGKFFLVEDPQKNVIGGIAIAFQNKIVRYMKGASDPDFRHLPVLHLAITEAIKSSRVAGYEYFDFWGYNHFVDENDQVFLINRFKKGFGGIFTFYPKKMHFVFRPIEYYLLNRIQKIYKKFFNKN